MKKLIILSESFRRNKEPKPIQAIARYSGVLFSIIKKYQKEGKMDNVDALIISEHHGLISPDEMIPYHPPSWRVKKFNGFEGIRQKNLERFSKFLKETAFSEIFVVAGKQYLKLIEGFEKLTKAKITYAKGSLGKKAQKLKKWILSNE